MNINRNHRIEILVLLLSVGIFLSSSSTYFFLLNSSVHLEMSNELDCNDIETSNQGYVDFINQKLFWFIHITDTQFLWSSNDKIEYFYQFLNESFQEINPLFIYNTGDLIDANHGLSQDIEEWSLYKKALEDNKMNSTIYLDLIGNHDAVHDSKYNYYLNYSLVGSTFKTLQYSFNKSFPFGNYAFIGLNTAKESYNLVEFALLGFLNSTELDWYESELEKYNDFDRIFVFGHHPNIISNLSSSGKTFSKLNEDYNVFSYFSGHNHENSFTKDNGLLMISTCNFDKDNGTYRIIAIDHNELSVSIEKVGIWPQGIITNPTNEEILKKGRNKIRILVWDPLGPTSVEWALYNPEKEFQITNWKPLINMPIENPLWEGDLDIQVKGKFLLKVKIEGGSGVTIKEIIINTRNTWIFQYSFIYILMTIIMVSISFIIAIYPKIHFRKNKKIKGIDNYI